MVERIIFNILAFVLFLVIFYKMIYRNDTNYIYSLAMQAIGFAIGFIGLIFNFKLPIVLLIISYLFSVIIPILIILLERKNINLTEAISMVLAKFYVSIGQEEKAKQVMLKLVDKYQNSYYGHKELAKIYEKQNDKEINETQKKILDHIWQKVGGEA